MNSKEDNCSIEFLKAHTGKFEIETIFTLIIIDKNITQINSLSKCLNLIFLNLSKNNLFNISGLENLRNLRFCDLSFNFITNIENIESMTKLRHLKVICNKIEFSKKIMNLKNSKIECLYLHEVNQIEKSANPICLIHNYRNEIFKIFTNLKILDGILKNHDDFALKDNINETDIKKLNSSEFNFEFKTVKIDEIFNEEDIITNKTCLNQKFMNFDKELEILKKEL